MACLLGANSDNVTFCKWRVRVPCHNSSFNESEGLKLRYLNHCHNDNYSVNVKVDFNVNADASERLNVSEVTLKDCFKTMFFNNSNLLNCPPSVTGRTAHSCPKVT